MAVAVVLMLTEIDTVQHLRCEDPHLHFTPPPPQPTSPRETHRPVIYLTPLGLNLISNSLAASLNSSPNCNIVSKKLHVVHFCFTKRSDDVLDHDVWSFPTSTPCSKLKHQERRKNTGM